MAHRWRRTTAATAAILVLLSACGSDGDETSGTSTTGSTGSTESTTVAEESGSLVVLVSNDDGIGAEGIDAVASALAALPDTEVIVYAPAEQQSGTGPRTTPDGADATPAATRSGIKGFAVDGYPADSVIRALDVDGVTPHLVVSGINHGANLGAFVEISGTVGAARAAAVRGIPALAVSTSILGESANWDEVVARVVEWVTERREALEAGEEPVRVTNLNVPSCETGTIRGGVEVETDYQNTDGGLLTPDCTSADAAGDTDMVAFSRGYATWSILTTKPTPNPFTAALADQGVDVG